jgi:hypothetical protein
MKHWASTLWLLSVLVLLCGCGGGQRTSGSPSNPPSGPPPQGLNIAGNWQFSTTPAVAGTPAMTIAGSISQSGSSLSGAVHIDGSNCFDFPTTVSLTGTVRSDNVSLTSTSFRGQVMTFTGAITNSTFTGTYSINGGCADGEQGNVAGRNVPIIDVGGGNTLNGTFTNSGGDTFDVSADIAQSINASPDGSFAITGTATFQTSCFNSGTLTSGRFPSGSYILGESVALLIHVGNGTLAYLGTEDLATGQISGTYTVSGGTCDQTGSAVWVVSNPWDY